MADLLDRVRTDTSDAAFLRKRAEAMEALTKIEIQFAQLRDVLYVERMEEVEKERAGIENGAFSSLFSFLFLFHATSAGQD
jgi:hypothetical protein